MTDRPSPEIRRLYYTEPAVRAFDAAVVRSFVHEGRPAVTLDRTAFYPTSGGQPHDTGVLGAARVLEVVDGDVDGGDVVHVVSEPIAEGTHVHGEIDWARRLDHMQQHSGQHVLSAAFERLTGNPTVSFHMGSETATIDLAREVGTDDVRAAEDGANAVVWEDRPVSMRFVSAAEAAALPLRKDPSREGTLRLIDVAGFDLSACGGTHVSRTGEIGLIVVLGWERFKGGSRVTFACGRRALLSHRSLHEVVSGSVSALSVRPSELPAAIERLQAESKDQRKAIKTLQESLASHEAARLLAGAAVVEGIRVVVQAVDGWDLAGLKTMSLSVVAAGGAVAVLLIPVSPAQVVVARSSDVSLDANALLRRLGERFGGKGGGRPDFAQGGGLTGDVQQILSAAAGFIEEALLT